MLIFGIDQGLAHMGYSVMDVITTKKCNRKGYIKIHDTLWGKILECDCIITTNDTELPIRLFKLITKLENKILEYEPDMVCCETLFFSPPAKGSRNKSSAIMTTNMVTGNIAYICGKHRIPFATYSPTNVKKLLCGSGRAAKEDVMAEIEKMFSVEAPVGKKDHMCDSIAIGMSCALKNLLNEEQKEESEAETSEPTETTRDKEDHNEDSLTKETSNENISGISDNYNAPEQKEKLKRKPRKTKTAKEPIENYETI